MSTAAAMAQFTRSVAEERLSDEVVEELSKRLLDSFGVAIDAIGTETVERVAGTVFEIEEDGPCQLWGRNGTASAPLAAMHNTALISALDYMDVFLAADGRSHPSETIGSVLTCGDLVDATGRELIEGLAVAYEIQGELSLNAPVQDRGFDYVTGTVIAATCGTGKLLGLDQEQLEAAVGIAATAHNALGVTRTGTPTDWTRLASATAARSAVEACLLARNGVAGPTDPFDGEHGWREVVAGRFEVRLDPGCEQVFETMTRRYRADSLAQSALEGVVQIATQYDIDPDRVEAIYLETFRTAGNGRWYEFMGEHSLPSLLASALVDREVTSRQYDVERRERPAIQRLSRRVDIEDHPDLTRRFEQGGLPAVVQVVRDDGTTVEVEKDAARGHPTRPMSWADIVAKYERLATTQYDDHRVERIAETVRTLPEQDVNGLVSLLDQPSPSD